MTNPLQRALASIALIAIALSSTACGGGGTTPTTSGLHTQSGCPMVAGNPCNPTGPIDIDFQALENGYTSAATLNDSTGAVTGDADDASGNQIATLSGTAGSAGTDTITANEPSVVSAPLTFSYLDAAYIQDGVNALPGGGTMTVDESSGTATGSITDATGTTWNASGALDSDGHDVDVSFTGSNGDDFTLTLDGNVFGGSGSQTQSVHTSAIRPQGARGIAVVAGAVAAGLGLVAAVAAVVPGGQFVAGIAGIGAATAFCVAAAAEAYDYYQSQHKGSKQ